MERAFRKTAEDTYPKKIFVHQLITIDDLQEFKKQLLQELLVYFYNSGKHYEANVIKYRCLKIRAGQYITKTLYSIDSSYNANAETLIKSTIREEERIAEQIKLLHLAGEKEKEAKELKAKAKENR